MADILRDPFWQGAGAILTLILGVIGFYYAGKNKNWLIFAGAVVVLIAGIAVGVSLSKSEEDKDQALAIEQIPQQVFAYEDPEADTWGAFWLIRADRDQTIYRFDYGLPSDGSGYAGLAFDFLKGSDLSAYDAVECVIVFSQSPDEVDLYFKDIAEHFATVRIANNGANEMALRYKFANFASINFHAVREFGLIASGSFASGEHQIRLKDIRFVK